MATSGLRPIIVKKTVKRTDLLDAMNEKIMNKYSEKMTLAHFPPAIAKDAIEIGKLGNLPPSFVAMMLQKTPSLRTITKKEAADALRSMLEMK